MAEILNPPRDRRRDLIAVGILIVLALATFGRIIGNGFVVWDDPQTISRNPWFNPPTLDSLGRAWREPAMDLWVPVTYTTWWLTALFSQPPDPAAYHALNLLLHAAAVACVFFLLRRLDFPTFPAALGAAVFAVHPIQVESVAWASGTKDVLSALLSIAALLAFLSPRRWLYSLGTLLFILALLAKPTAIVVPVLAAILARFVLRRPWKLIVQSAGPWLVPALLIGIIAARTQPAHLAADQQVNLFLRPLVATDALAFYLGKLLWPFHLAIDYGRSPANAWEHRWLLWTWLIPFAVVAMLWRAASRAAWLAFWLFVVALMPVLGWVRTDFQYYSTVADHYLYLPMLGVAVLIASVMCQGEPARPRAGGRLDGPEDGPAPPRAPAWIFRVYATGIVLALAVISTIQVGHWRNTQSLFARTLDVNPTSVAAYSNLAFDAAEHDRPEDAIELAQKALALRPRNTQALTTLASQYARLGQLDRAEAAYRQAIDSAPDDARPLSNLAGLLAQQGHIEAALPMAQRAVDLDPDLAQARLNYGTMLANLGQTDAAIEQLQRAVRLDPADPQAVMNLAILLDRAGRRGEAIDHLRRFLTLRRADGPARQLLDELSRVPR